MTKLNGKTPDLAAENIEQLRQIFPDVFEEGKIDFDKLKQVLGEYVDDEKERYNFTWNGKGKALRLAQTPTTGTLRPCPEEGESKNWDDTQNLYIEGDNLEVLKLLQKSYHGKIKMIFIDPPYNTGSDFVYPDNFADSIENYKKITGQVDDKGKSISTNSEFSGRFHTDWLNMMYPRLRLARNLLRDDGIIFISLDDTEIDNLKKICNEVFGEHNFVAWIVWQHSIQPKGYTDTFSLHHNHILCYQKSGAYKLGSFERTAEDNKAYSNPDNDPNGPWRSGDVRNALYRPNLIYDIISPSGKVIKPCANGWRWSKETVESKIKSGEIIFSEDETRIIRKIYLNTLEGRPPETIWFAKDAGSTRDAMGELKDLFTVSPFDTPKPTALIKRMAILANDPTGICLDFFAGSSSTAHAIMKLNAEDGGNRKFIMVQLPEPCADGTEAAKAGFENICEIGKERIRRAGEKIKAEVEEQNAQLKIGEEPRKVPDIGFKVFKLDSSNLKQWQPDYDDLETTLFNSISNYVEGRSELDVVYEIMLKMGMELTWPLETHTIGGKNVYEIGMGALMICLDDHITTEVAEGMAALYKELAPETWRVVFKDNGFENDSAKVNIKEILKRAGLEEDAFTTV